jgi:hypothetical protein
MRFTGYPLRHTRRKSYVDGQRSYYAAALTALRFAEQRSPTGRRFGKEADAAWRAFKGSLTMADRIDLLLRNADAQWKQAFGARSVYALRAIAEDEPYGAEWQPLSARVADKLWRELNDIEAPRNVKAALRDCAAAWELSLKKVTVEPLRATTKLVLAGPSAIAAYCEHFAEEKSLAWARQVACIATSPAHRQLAFLAGALVDSTEPAQVLAAAEAKGLKRAGRAVVSPDADAADAAAAESAGS